MKVFNAYGADLGEFPGAILARLTIFFKEAQFITSKRSELYGLTGKLLTANLYKNYSKNFILRFYGQLWRFIRYVNLFFKSLKIFS